MRAFRLAISFTVLLFAAQAFAQEGLVGAYSATFGGFSNNSRGKPWTQVLTLQISTVGEGKVTGKLNVAKFGCSGDHSMSGVYKDGELKMSSSDGDKPECPKVTLRLGLQGTNLVGTFGKTPVDFKKQ